MDNIPTGWYVSPVTAKVLTRRKNGGGREKLLDAAVTLIRANGWAATSVEALCAAASVTKGAFFHHFPTKEAVGVAAADHWTAMTAPLFATAPYHEPADPLDRVLGYIDFRRDLIAGEARDYSCVVGTLAQEVHESSAAIRDACERSISEHAERLEPDIAAAMALHGVSGDWTAASLARHTQAVLQGAFILAKAANDPERARESLDHLRRYIELLFNRPAEATTQRGNP